MDGQEFSHRVRVAVEALRKRQDIQPGSSVTMPIIIGDKIEDLWVLGHQRRMAQEGPYPVFAADENRSWISPGGANAVSRQVHKLLGNLIVTCMRHGECSQKSRYIDASAERVVFRSDSDIVSYDTNRTLSQAIATAKNRTLHEIEQNGSGLEIEWLLVLCDYGKGTLWNPVDISILEPCVGVWVDPHPKTQPWLYEYATLVSCSADEVRAAEEAFLEGGQRPVMVRRNGKSGSSLSYDGYQEIDIPAVRVLPVRCTVACGDAYMAGMVSAACALGNVHSEETLLTAACFGALIASLKVGRWGMSEPVCLEMLSDQFIDELSEGLMDGTAGTEFDRYPDHGPVWAGGSAFPDPEDYQRDDEPETDTTGAADAEQSED